MNPETKLILFRACSEFFIGAGIALVSGLSQWATGQEQPSRIAWIIIIVSALVAGAKNLASFMSSAFSNYKAQTDQLPPSVGPPDPAPEKIL